LPIILAVFACYWQNPTIAAAAAAAAPTANSEQQTTSNKQEARSKKQQQQQQPTIHQSKIKRDLGCQNAFFDPVFAFRISLSVVYPD